MERPSIRSAGEEATLAASVASFSGLASGLDSNALITAMVNTQKAPLSRVLASQDVLKSQVKKFGNLKTLLTTLGTAADALRKSTDVLTAKGTSSDDTAVKVTAQNGATAGSYDVLVTQLAQAERTYSDGFSSKTTAGLFGSGTVDITTATGTVSINVDAGDTLENVSQKINASGIDAKSSLFFDGTNWRLSVTGTKTGADNDISFVETGVSLGLSNPANEVQEAKNAQFTIDGFAIESPTNVVSTAIANVTLDFKKVSTDPTTITIESDVDAIATKVQAFVTAYNAVETFMDTESAFIGVQKGADSLSGDSTLRTIQTRLRSALGTAFPAAAPYTSLASIGVESQKDGSLKLDKAKLETAFKNDPDKVAQLFSKATNPANDGAFAKIYDTVNTFTSSSDGIITGRINTMNSRVRNMDKQMISMQQRIDKYEETLRTKYAKLEQQMSELQSQGSQMSGSLSGLG